MAQLTIHAAPERLRKGAGGYPQPVALLARLGVDIRHEGRGLGAAPLQDVFARLLELSDDIGCRGLLVHAESADAGAFYRHLVPEFEASPTDDLHLVLLMKDIRRTCAGEAEPFSARRSHRRPAEVTTASAADSSSLSPLDEIAAVAGGTIGRGSK
jgi:hypothetical protein